MYSDAATAFSIRIANRSSAPLMFQEGMVDFHGSNDSRRWIPVPLVSAKESTQYSQRAAGQGPADRQLPAFLRDATIGPNDCLTGLVEHGHQVDEPEYRCYRLSVSAAGRAARFHLENLRLRGPDPRLEPARPGFVEQWRLRSGADAAEDR